MKRLNTVMALLLSATLLYAKAHVGELKVEGLVNPIGVDHKKPTFSWISTSDKRNVVQTAYELSVFDNAALKGAPLWSSGKVNSDHSIHIAYGGDELKPSTRYYWQVKVWNNQGEVATSKQGYWQTGLLETTNWKAKWIEVANHQPNETRSPYLRKGFKVDKKIASAVAYITARGMYEAYINGQRVGDAYLTPGWTSYDTRLQYQAYDVTKLMKQGENVVGAFLGNGWYKGTLNWEPRENIYGDKLALLCQLEVTYSDGTQELIGSDGSWKSGYGAIQWAEIYNGECYDATQALTGWSEPGYNEASWQPVKEASYGYNNLIATYNQPIKKQEVFTTTELITTPKGEQVLDFGQNLVGWEKIRIKGNKGDTIRVYHAEMLDKAGNFYTANLRSAAATSTYILSGEMDTLEPHFTFYGFRYLKIEGVAAVNPLDVEAIALYSDMPENGDFSCSHPLINKLQQNIAWGQKGNFLDVPTDCPQRNERLGWTGDAQAFFRTAVFIRDGKNFFKKWMKDVAADQYKDGRVPWVIPHTLLEDQVASTGWGDVATIIPWQLYRAYGDEEILHDQYESMKGWVEFMRRSSVDHLWNTQKEHFGDWLFYRPDDDKDGIAAITDKQLIAQCFYAHSTELLAKTAEVLGKTGDATQYSALLEEIKKAFNREYVTTGGRLVSGTQTAYVLALYFDMLPEALRAQAVDRLVENIERYNHHLTTGFLGTPYICHVLSRFGRTDMAYKLLLQESYPSWLYPVKAGATTIWERWDGRKPDGTFQTDEMNSFNHYAYGAIGDWLYRVVAGLQEAAPGYKALLVKPHMEAGLTQAKATQGTPYGQASSAWELKEGRCIQQVEVPVNSSALIYIPTSDQASITEGGKPIHAVRGVEMVGQEDGYVVVKVGSGNYHFESKQ